MLVNPLFDHDEDNKQKHPKDHDEGYVLKHRRVRTIQPLHTDIKPDEPAQPDHKARVVHHTNHPVQPSTPNTSQTPIAAVTPGQQVDPSANAAVELIRRKVQSLYAGEPDVKEELQEAAEPVRHPSKHQQFMQQLSTSGKSLAQIQTEWHNYYVALPDDEKHEVWREFYQTNSKQPSAYTSFVAGQVQASQKARTPIGLPGAVSPSSHEPKPQAVVAEHLPSPNYEAQRKHRTMGTQLKKQIVDKVGLSAEAQRKAKQHFQSLVFGIGTGLIVLVVFLFGFFNEVIIAPFIQPSRHVSATPIIVGSDTVAAGDSTEVIIPKINVQIPTVYNVGSSEEANIENNLEDGVVHYPTTVEPGQKGNAAFFGHSSNNIFNKGKYKFAFVLLHELVPGDIFYLTYNKTVYTYRVYDKKIVPPSQVSVLNNVPDKTATATLITCDPPGTSTNRLVVWGEQISPDPAGATAPTTNNSDVANTTPTSLPSEGPTLWGRFWKWLTN